MELAQFVSTPSTIALSASSERRTSRRMIGALEAARDQGQDSAGHLVAEAQGHLGPLVEVAQDPAAALSIPLMLVQASSWGGSHSTISTTPPRSVEPASIVSQYLARAPLFGSPGTCFQVEPTMNSQ